ncbi:glycoside hydrolase family 3 protein [Actinospica robiniae]|uniref:glycoside hydrolase family 3 protein n=1 Tax=Actinospica robiniae TaxID=304901 RepID=UPI0004199EAC|nr:glycoside hydrolase family 3 protein [Actinospica robiniae]
MVLPADLSRLALHVLQPGFAGTQAPEWVRRRIGEGLGSVLLFGRNVRDADQVATLTAALHAENPKLIIGVDEEGGDVTRLEAASGSSYPGNLALGAVDDAELTRKVARSLGRRMVAAGIDLDYAPDADVNNNPANPVIGVRSFGADPELVARHVAAWVEGLQSTGIAGCAKHFPGHGDTAVDSHVALPTVRMSRAELAATALPPFRAAIDAGVRAVMLGHLLLPALDAEHPASVSRAAVDLLRRDLGFRGLITTDALEMAAVARRYGVEGAAVRALAAGVDLLCVGHEGDDALVGRLQAAIVDAVLTGELGEERLAEASGRVVAFLAEGGREADEKPTDDDEEIGLEATRRALRVTISQPGALPLATPPHHVAFTSAGPVALGSVADTALGTQLLSRMPGTTVALLGECTDAAIEHVLAAASGRPLVLGVRSAHRHEWMGDALSRILAARPDAIVAELGLPGSRPAGAAYLVAHGASRACAAAVAEVLCPSRS